MTLAAETRPSTTRPFTTVAAELEEIDVERERRRTSERDRRRAKADQAQDVLTKLLIADDTVGHVSAEKKTNAQRAIADAELEIRANDATIDALEKKRAPLVLELISAKELERQAIRASVDEQRRDVRRERLEVELAFCRTAAAEARLDQQVWRADDDLNNFYAGQGVVKRIARPSYYVGHGPTIFEQVAHDAHVLAEELRLAIDTETWTTSPIASAPTHNDQVEGDEGDEDDD